MDLAGNNKWNLTNSGSTDGTPSFSPDRKNVVFGSNRDQSPNGPWEIYTMPATGSTSPVNISNNPAADDGWPVWSPKGDRILFLSDREEGSTDKNVYTMNADGNNVERITFDHNVAHAAWSPDGSQIVFAANGEIYILPLSTGVPTKLTDNSAYDDYPSWSPDNNYIIYSSAQISDNNDKLDLFMVNIKTKSVTCIMNNELDIRYPAWLPDDRVVLTMAVGKSQSSTREIYITKGAVDFSSLLTLSDLTQLTLNNFEDNHPMVAVALKKFPLGTFIPAILSGIKNQEK